MTDISAQLKIVQRTKTSNKTEDKYVNHTYLKPDPYANSFKITYFNGLLHHAEKRE